ncbi:hypothetical protein ONO23_05512 [Micromonospora noduli]|uniref:hypothetical protein n=1 Tax=Micromonospora noduli TaxID=709876 RepID=UPI000DC04F05|nr:hypothetical protein [Micromonospora noduli]RAO26109.1 hypothetical protein ONO23_05512 [Micromonospora noduli]
MSTAARRPPPRNTRPYAVDEATIRRRCANPDAADYTLYVRSLIDEYLGIGGQSAIIRNARKRRLDFPGLNRQKLSEQLSRYRLGPTWEMTELIIGCLPDSCDTASIRALAAGWYECARGYRPLGYNGPVSRPPGKPGQRNVPESEPAVPVLQRKLARLQERLREETDRYMENLRASQKNRNYEHHRANQLEAQFHQTRDELLRVKTIAAEVATLREDYARQCACLEYIAAPSLRGKPIIDLPEPPLARRRIHFGLLVASIDHQAPPARRALARYLCAYTEMVGVSPTELASRADIAVTVAMDILAGRLVPTAAHATRLATVLDCVPETLRHLSTAASNATALDECFWSIAGKVDPTTSRPDLPGPDEPVGSDPDNRSTYPHNTPTPLSPIAERLRQLAVIYRDGLVSDGEYAEQRERILGEL